MSIILAPRSSVGMAIRQAACDGSEEKVGAGPLLRKANCLFGGGTVQPVASPFLIGLLRLYLTGRQFQHGIFAERR